MNRPYELAELAVPQRPLCLKSCNTEFTERPRDLCVKSSNSTEATEKRSRKLEKPVCATGFAVSLPP